MSLLAALACLLLITGIGVRGDSETLNLHIPSNPYRSRGASLLYTQTTPYGSGPAATDESVAVEAAYPYFYDDRSPLPLHLRRQRQFVPVRDQDPVVLSRGPPLRRPRVEASEQSTPRVEIRELPAISNMSPQARRLFLSQLFSPRPPQQLHQSGPPPVPQPQPFTQPRIISPFMPEEAIKATSSVSFSRGGGGGPAASSLLKPVPAVPPTAEANPVSQQHQQQHHQLFQHETVPTVPSVQTQNPLFSASNTLGSNSGTSFTTSTASGFTTVRLGAASPGLKKTTTTRRPENKSPGSRTTSFGPANKAVETRTTFRPEERVVVPENRSTFRPDSRRVPEEASRTTFRPENRVPNTRPSSFRAPIARPTFRTTTTTKVQQPEAASRPLSRTEISGDGGGSSTTSRINAELRREQTVHPPIGFKSITSRPNFQPPSPPPSTSRPEVSRSSSAPQLHHRILRKKNNLQARQTHIARKPLKSATDAAAAADQTVPTVPSVTAASPTSVVVVPVSTQETEVPTVGTVPPTKRTLKPVVTSFRARQSTGRSRGGSTGPKFGGHHHPIITKRIKASKLR